MQSSKEEKLKNKVNVPVLFGIILGSLVLVFMGFQTIRLICHSISEIPEQAWNIIIKIICSISCFLFFFSIDLIISFYFGTIVYVILSDCKCFKK